MTALPDRLSPDDARILAMESDVVMGHTLKLMILAPGEPLQLEDLREAVLERLPSKPRALQRIEPGDNVSGAHWAQSPHFDIADHVRRRAGAECTTRTDLRMIVSGLMSEHLDRDRPLWTLDLIGPLADGSEAIAARMHHAMVDGIAGIRFVEDILLDPHDAPLHTIGVQPPPASTISSKGVDEWFRMPGALARELAHPGGPSPFDRPLTKARELSFVSTPLLLLKEIGASRPQHATVNDVLLSIVAGGLHTWLDRHDGGPHGGGRVLRAQVPVSLHHREEQAGADGNRDSFINVNLPLGERDPLRRLDRISAQTRTEKQQGDAQLLYDLFHALGRVAPAEELAQRIAGSAREFSFAISNVPGPRVPVAVAGRSVDQLFTSSEPGAHHALRVSAISNATEIGIGFCTDPTAVSGVGMLATDVTDAFDQLLRAGRAA